MKLTLALAALLVAYVKAQVNQDWTTVSKGFGSTFNLDFEKYSLEVETGTSDKERDIVGLGFFDSTNADAGSVFLSLPKPTTSSKIGAYTILYCENEKEFELPDSAFVGSTRIWKFTIISDKTLHIMCNGEEVLHVEFLKDCDQNDWQTYWDKKHKRVKFDNMDTVSIRYRQAALPNTDSTESSFEYKVTYSIWNNEEASSNSPQYVKIGGNKGQTKEYLCSDVNFNVVNRDVECAFKSEVDIGDYKSVSLRTGGSNGLDLTKVTVQINNKVVHEITPTQAGYFTLDDEKTLTFTVTSCAEGFWTCQDKQQCVRDSQKCDAEKDCLDGSDEASCETNGGGSNNGCSNEGWMKCMDGKKCIDPQYWCDGKMKHCEDGSDEAKCDAGETVDCNDGSNWDHPECYASAAKQGQLLNSLLVALVAALVTIGF